MPGKYTGGYLIERLPLVRADNNGHTAALDNPISPATLSAVNALQATPWRVNRWVLDVMADAWDKGLRVAGLPGDAPERPVRRMQQDDWAALTPAQQRDHIDARRALWDKHKSHVGRTQALLDQLTVAEKVRDRPAIWFPHTLDFRHRIYPATSAGPQPQGDDRGKALLMFANGLPLGPDGLFWLCVRAANCAGQDKLPLDQRVEWTLARMGEIQAVAGNPLQRSDYWGGMDEPWQFLATAHELDQAWASGNPEGFVSHLPVPLDGSCNGLQHLSAMGLDSAGAVSTNLARGPRRDIYSDVAEEVRRSLEALVKAGNADAATLLPTITRATVKRAVMTTPYGVTSRGIRSQLVNDGMVPGTFRERPHYANLLGPLIERAVGSAVAGGREIMAWLQGTAKTLAESGHPLQWTTPAGSVCRQSYYVESEARIDTALAAFRFRVRASNGLLMPRKQALGAAPNFVHSFDAAHTALTVNAAVEDGMRSFAMIHDSYASHACNTTALAHILRKEFVGIYREDWLIRVYDEVRGYAKGAQLNPPPARGDFDIEQVLDSEFFFS